MSVCSVPLFIDMYLCGKSSRRWDLCCRLTLEEVRDEFFSKLYIWARQRIPFAVDLWFVTGLFIHGVSDLIGHTWDCRSFYGNTFDPLVALRSELLHDFRSFQADLCCYWTDLASTNSLKLSAYSVNDNQSSSLLVQLTECDAWYINEKCDLSGFVQFQEVLLLKHVGTEIRTGRWSDIRGPPVSSVFCDENIGHLQCRLHWSH